MRRYSPPGRREKVTKKRKMRRLADFPPRRVRKGVHFPTVLSLPKSTILSHTHFPHLEGKKKSAKLKCFRKQNICLRVRKRFSEKVNKSKDPTIRTKNLKRSSYLWPSKYLNHAISLGTWLGTLHISRCLPEDLHQLPPRVTAPPPAPQT